MNNKIRIKSAAIYYNDKVYFLPRPNRHHDVLRFIHKETGDMSINGVQGFVLSDGKFVGREMAKIVAIRAGQLLDHNLEAKELYSEDVW